MSERVVCVCVCVWYNYVCVRGGGRSGVPIKPGSQKASLWCMFTLDKIVGSSGVTIYSVCI